MNFKEIVLSGKKYNFHTHTEFCDGRSTMSEIVSEAVAGGFRHIGFTPHSPVSIYSPCNMQEQDVSAYKAELVRLKELYAGQCNIYCGMEFDYLGAEYPPIGEQYKKYGLDYAIASIHFIKNQKGELVDVDGNFENFKIKMSRYFDNDIRYVVEEYFKASTEMLCAGGFDILGHFDKIALNSGLYHKDIEHELWYKNLISEYIDKIIASNVIVEINTKARVEYGRFFPNERYWKQLIDSGVTIMVNSDAHYADRLNQSRYEAFNILEKL